MFSLFKNQTKLVDLIPENYIDIHSHILPGIDDGSENYDQTLFLIENMKEMGFKQCIPTPHTLPHTWDNTRESITICHAETLSKLPETLKKMIPRVGTEYMIEGSFLERMKNETLLTLKDNKVLIEMSYLNAPMDFKKIVFEIQMNGYTPILAHPERYSFYHQSMREYEKLKEIGCFFQLNLLSTVGYYGKNVASIADKLLKQNMIDFTGSDIHHKRHIEAFQNKVLISSTKQLVEAMKRNSIFGNEY
jgi:protein-tyrosine phosphatase